MLELAQTVIRVTGSTSEIVFEALPTDDPQVRRPDITRARQILGWAPEIDLEEGLRRWLQSLGPEPVDRLSMRRVGGHRRRSADGVSSLRPRGPPTARAIMRVGIYDEAQTLYGPVDKTFALFKQLHVQEVRLNLYWGGHVRRREAPAGARHEPRRPRLRLGPLRPHRRATRSRTASTSSSRSTARRPGRTAATGRTSRRRARSTCATSRSPPRSATAARTWAPTGGSCPPVKEWLAWNEPNNPLFLAPQYRKSGKRWVIQSAIDYAQDLQRGLQRRARDARRRTSASPAASPRRAATTTRRARARPSRRSRSCARSRRPG